MSLASRLRSIRAILAAGVALRAIGWGTAAGFSLIVGAALIDLVVPLAPGTRWLLLILAIVTTIGVAATLSWRDRAVLSIPRVALWIEEHFPSLEYTLVTAVESGNDHLVSSANATAWAPAARKRAMRVIGAPLLVIASAIVVILLLPAGAVARMRAPRPGDLLERTGLTRNRDDRLTPLVADIVPPAYSGERASSIDEPTDIRTLEGSRIAVRGRGDATGLVAVVGADTVKAVARGDRWSITIAVSAKPVAMRVRDGAAERIIAIEPVIDNAPTVLLRSPAHDSVLRTASGRIPLSADASDDFSITSASFELIVSSGEGESFQFKAGVLGTVQPNARTTSLNASLSIDSLGLKPGDIVHLRAVARDANNVSGPGVGVSETRSIRIARPDEYDSVAVEAAAPSEAEKGVLSQRMLIMLAEALQKKKPSLAKPAFVGESRAIAVDQKKLRRSVGDIVFMRLGADPKSEEGGDDEPQARAKTMEELLARADSATNVSTNPLDFEGDESPVVAVNKPLLEAYNAMWEASTHLEIGEVDRALPPMRRALEAIQRARKAERLYLRGIPPRVVIDINKARLTGKDKGSSSLRRPVTAADSVTQRLLDRFTRIVELSARNAPAAADSLLVLRIDALSDAPAVAAALSDAAKAIRAGKGADATQALARARRALAGSPVARDTLSRWGIVP
jgi:hypothetical protein